MSVFKGFKNVLKSTSDFIFFLFTLSHKIFRKSLGVVWVLVLVVLPFLFLFLLGSAREVGCPSSLLFKIEWTLNPLFAGSSASCGFFPALCTVSACSVVGPMPGLWQRYPGGPGPGLFGPSVLCMTHSKSCRCPFERFLKMFIYIVFFYRKTYA